jgi:hypothetical protein
MSLTLELIDAAGPMFSHASGSTSVGLPATSACGAAQSPGPDERADAGRGPLHPQRLEDALGDEVFPRAAGHRRHQLPGDHEHQVLVGVGGAQARRRRDGAHLAQDLVARHVGRREPEEIAGAQAEAAAVRDQVAHHELARDVRVGELEARQALAHLVVPRELVLVDEHGQRGGGEGLGVGGDGEQGVGADRRRRAQLAYAPAARQDHLAVLDHRDGGARGVEGGQRPQRGIVELVGDRRPRQQQRGGDEEQSAPHVGFSPCRVRRSMRCERSMRASRAACETLPRARSRRARR